MTAIHATLDPVQLLRSNRAAQQELVEIADRPVTAEATPPSAPTVEQFLVGLRTARREGHVRPTSKPKEKASRGHRRPDPFVTMTALIREWFKAEPWRTSREFVRSVANGAAWSFPRWETADAATQVVRNRCERRTYATRC